MGNQAANIRAATQVLHPGAVVTERTRHGLKHQGVTGRVILDQSRELHYDREASWAEIDTELIDDTGAFDHQDKDSLPYRFKMSNAGRRRIMFRRAVPTEFIEFEPVERWNGSIWQTPNHPTPARVDDRLQWDGGPNWGVGYSVRARGVKATYVAKTPTGANDIRWAYTLTGCTFDGNNIVSDSDGTVVMVLKPASLADSSPGYHTKREVTQTIDATHITLTPDYAGLTFPVRVDPTVEDSPGVDADDGFYAVAADFFDDGSDGTYTMDVGYFGSASSDTNAWMRFPGVAIDNAQSLDVAYLELEAVDANGSGSATINTVIHIINEDDHAAPTNDTTWTTDHGIHTGATTWDFTRQTSGNMQSPSILTGIQTVIDRAGWATGQDIGIHIDDDGTATGADNIQEWESHENLRSTGVFAVLHIEYNNDATVTPTALSPTATLTAPVTAAAATVVATAILATAVLTAPAVSVGVTIAAVALTPTAARDVPIVAGSATVSPSAYVATHVLPTPTVTTFSGVDLYATGVGTIVSVVDEIDTTTDIHLSVDDDPDSPNDADYMNNIIDGASIFLDITNVPGDFGNAEVLKLVARTRGQNWFSGSLTLYAQVFQSDESTALTDELSVVVVAAGSSFANTSLLTFTGLNTTANAAVWNGARIRFRWAVT